MKELVMKDIRLVGMKNLFVLGACILWGVIAIFVDNAFISNYFYGLGIFGNYFFVSNAIYTGELSSKSDALIISLPVKKFDIVKSRYLTMIIYIFSTLCIMSLTSFIAKKLFSNALGNPLSLMGAFVIAGIMIVFTSIHIPFKYYDHKSSQFLLGIMFMLVASSGKIIDRLSINLGNSSLINKLLTMNFVKIGVTLLALALVLYLISMFVSKGIYEAKEF